MSRSDVGIAIGVGRSFAFPVMIMKKPRVLHEFVNGFPAIGQTLPTAIGMAVALGKPFALIEGDGGVMQNIQELDTASRLGLKLLFNVRISRKVVNITYRRMFYGEDA